MAFDDDGPITPATRSDQPAQVPLPSGERKGLRCRLGVHKWTKRTNDEGGRYLECARCGKEDNMPDSAGPRVIPG